jgi:hypothetical protein
MATGRMPSLTICGSSYETKKHQAHMAVEGEVEKKEE